MPDQSMATWIDKLVRQVTLWMSSKSKVQDKDVSTKALLFCVGGGTDIAFSRTAREVVLVVIVVVTVMV